MTAINHTTDSALDRSVGRWATWIRWSAAIVFVVFGAGKFVNHASELASFHQYALPLAGAFVYAIGGLEIAGGLLLLTGRWVRLASLALAIDMVGAIAVSGVGRGEYVSLTLAPLLLVAMIFLVGVGAGPRSSARGRAAKPRSISGSDPV